MSAPSQDRGGVTLVNRVGIRMYVSIGHGGLPTANFAVGPPRGQRSASGQPLVLATIHNSGQRTLAISGDLTLANGPGGLRAGPFPVKLGAALAPGDSEPLTVTLNKILPRGPWRAEIRLSSGLLQRTAEATIRFPPDSRSRLPVAELGAVDSVLFSAAADHAPVGMFIADTEGCCTYANERLCGLAGLSRAHGVGCWPARGLDSGDTERCPQSSTPSVVLVSTYDPASFGSASRQFDG